jgi:hypothetical protein
MKATIPWSTYRTRFVVNAKQLTTSLTFTDALGRQHSGRKGDYLVESDGVLRIHPRQIFEDIYVPLETGEHDTSVQLRTPAQYKTPPPDEISLHPSLRQRQTSASLLLPPHLPRKSPQPYRDRRSPIPGLRSL